MIASLNRPLLAGGVAALALMNWAVFDLSADQPSRAAARVVQVPDVPAGLRPITEPIRKRATFGEARVAAATPHAAYLHGEAVDFTLQAAVRGTRARTVAMTVLVKRESYEEGERWVPPPVVLYEKTLQLELEPNGLVAVPLQIPGEALKSRRRSDIVSIAVKIGRAEKAVSSFRVMSAAATKHLERHVKLAHASPGLLAAYDQHRIARGLTPLSAPDASPAGPANAATPAPLATPEG